MPVYFHYEDVDIKLNERKYVSWIQECLSKYFYREGNINIIFVTTDEIVRLNREYLNHDFPTDIITFNYNEGKLLSGDIFICHHVVANNAESEGVPFAVEISRVIIHGILHLVGFDDKSEQDIQKMRDAENSCLSNLKI